MSVRAYLTLECMAEVPGCVSERCQCWCHGAGNPQHGTPGGHVTTFRIDNEGTWPAAGQALFFEQWLISEWARRLTIAGGRPLGIPNVWVDYFAHGITNEVPPDAIQTMMAAHGIRPGDPAVWHAEGSAERMPDDARQR